VNEWLRRVELIAVAGELMAAAGEFVAVTGDLMVAAGEFVAAMGE
jgi:hypothetical protein